MGADPVFLRGRFDVLEFFDFAWHDNSPTGSDGMKRFVIVGGVLAVMGIVAVFILMTQLGPIITRAVEHFGSAITQTRVDLEETEISASSGQGALRGLRVSNPENFKTESAFEFSEVGLMIDVSTLTQPTVVVKEVLIAGPEITYELGAGGSNIDAIKKNIDGYVKSLGLQEGKGDKEKAAAKEGKKLIIEKFSLRDGKVNVSAAFLEGKTMTVRLPNIELRDIGKAKGGASPGEVSKQMFAALNQAVSKAVSGLDLGEAKKLVGDVASGVKDELEKGGDPKDVLEKAGKDVGAAVKGLFGN